MKNSKIILTSIAAMLLVSLASCSRTDTGVVSHINRYINKSGIEIAMVGKTFNADIPDSLVIPNGQTFECSLRYPAMASGDYVNFPYDFGDPYDESKFIPIKVYYDKTICVSYIYKNEGKNHIMFEEGSYIEERTEKKDLAIFIDKVFF